MAVKSFKKVTQENPAAEKFQQNVEEVLRPIVQSAIIDGVLLTAVQLTTGQSNLVDHKLARAPVGWLVVRKRATADIWDEQDANTLASRTIDLRCSANCTVDLWIF